MVDKAREVALKTLYRINNEGAYSNIALDEEINKNAQKLNAKDIGLISEIVYGVITWKLTIDEIIKKYSKIRLKKISPWILDILRLSIYQIVFLNKIPKSAAVNEGVNLAKRYGHRSSSGFTNAILRKVEKQDYEDFKNIKDDKERLSKQYSMPLWIIDELADEGLEIEKIEKICSSSNIRPKVSIRVNTLKTNKEELKQILEKENIKTTDGILEDFLILDKAKNIEKSESFKNGLFTVQDEAAGLTALILNPKKGEKILDACSSPGGKTTYIAQLVENDGQIVAFDIHEHRTKLVEQTTKRLGINIIETKVQDASKFDEKYENKFDKILLDVPCLGIGVLRRKPDIKWQKKKEDVKEISEIQYKILECCSKYLKSNGELVYSTCSILKEENENLVKRFLKNNKEFELEKIKILDKNFFKNYLKDEQFLQVYQNENTDGFFICKLSKK